MTPHLATTLAQLAALTRPELTVLAAAAQALAAAEPHPASAAQAPLPAPVRIRRRPRARHMGWGTVGVHAETGGTLGGSPDATTGGPRLCGQGRGERLDAVAPVDPGLFASAAYRRRLGPTVPGLLYAAGCDGLLALTERLNRPLYKVGTAEGRTTAMRMSTLAASRYACAVRDGGGFVEEDGFDHWRAVGLPLVQRRGRGSPVAPALRAISYQRPASLPQVALDRAVATMLEPAGLDAFVASAEGRAACRDRGVDPASLDRYTPSALGCPEGRSERARELVLLGPRVDAERIAAVLEAVIATHVMACDPA